MNFLAWTIVKLSEFCEISNNTIDFLLFTKILFDLETTFEGEGVSVAEGEREIKLWGVFTRLFFVDCGGGLRITVGVVCLEIDV